MTIPTVLIMAICVVTAFLIGVFVMRITQKKTEQKAMQALGAPNKPIPAIAALYLQGGSPSC
jgi:ABC-type lipoprotein release transport system permease subunit